LGCFAKLSEGACGGVTALGKGCRFVGGQLVELLDAFCGKHDDRVGGAV